MNEVTSKVYVRFIDGIEVFIPIEARLISDDVFQLMPDPEFDYEDGAVLFEFGSQDIVKTKEKQLGNGVLGRLAYELVKAGDTRNLQKWLLTQIVLQTPNPQVILEGIDRSEIKSLCQRIEKAPFMYPSAKDWLLENKEKIQSMM